MTPSHSAQRLPLPPPRRPLRAPWKPPRPTPPRRPVRKHLRRRNEVRSVGSPAAAACTESDVRMRERCAGHATKASIARVQQQQPHGQPHEQPRRAHTLLLETNHRRPTCASHRLCERESRPRQKIRKKASERKPRQVNQDACCVAPNIIKSKSDIIKIRVRAGGRTHLYGYIAPRQPLC